MAYTYSRMPWGLIAGWPTLDPGVQTGRVIDTTYTYEVNGESWFVRLAAPVGQTSGSLTIHIYVIAETGTADSWAAEVRNSAMTGGDDTDRPEASGSTLATLSGVDLSGSAGTWVSLTFTGLTLVAGNSYFIIVHNTHATKASNSLELQYRGGMDAILIPESAQMFRSGYNTVGWLGDPAVSVGSACCVVKFDDGTLIGNPFVDNSLHASNANDRGSRFVFTEDLLCSGLIHDVQNTLVSGVEINEAVGGANIATRVCNTNDAFENRGVRFAPPVTLRRGVAYDAVLTYSAASATHTVYDMGEAEGSVPADVLACVNFGNGTRGHVTGTTPGSYTLDKSKLSAIALILDSNPAKSRVLAHPGMAGGMVA